MAIVAASTDAGARKKANEDAYCVKVAKTSAGEVAFAVVCDGVGGLNRGEFASSAVAQAFSDWFDAHCASYLDYNFRESTIDLSRLEGIWGQLLDDLNKSLHRYGVMHEGNLGTTVSCMLAYRGSYAIAHVGDCRIYRIAPARIEALTKDQTWVQSQVDTGLLTVEEASNHPGGNVILQSVGSQEDLSAEFITGTYGADDAFLLCCDGVYRTLGDDGLLACFGQVKAMSEAACSRACRAAIEQSMRNGSSDNVTAVVVVPDPGAGSTRRPSQRVSSHLREVAGGGSSRKLSRTQTRPQMPRRPFSRMSPAKMRRHRFYPLMGRA